MTRENLANTLAIRFDEIEASLAVAGISRREAEAAKLLGTEVAFVIEDLRKKESRRMSEEIGY